MGQKGRWTIDGAALDRLLARLDDDRERAAVAYEAMRSRLQALLRWWGSADPLDLADKALDRVAMKLSEGAEVPNASLSAYIRSVARLLFYESLREAEREETAFREAPRFPAPDAAVERALDALDGCLDSLSVAERGLILDYYGDAGPPIVTRRRLAATLSLSPTALRIRAHRVRERLETCVEGSLETSAHER
jgi:DNA-directed RNA polymerase specialized sigma24 family protein